MSSFVNNLINRHINTENLIRPRFRSMFEAESLNQGKSVINEFKDTSPVASKTQGFNAEQEPVADDKENKNVPATLKPQITLPQKDNENNLQTEKQVITPKYNVPIQEEGKNNDEKLLGVNQFAGDVKNANRKLSDIIEHNEKVNADSSTIKEESVNKHAALNSNTGRDHVNRSFLNNDQTTVSEQVKNEFQNSKINAYPGTAFFDKYIPLKSKQQPATIQPAIKVTIGQIDVKAISEPQPVLTKNKSAAEPRMSLDDYLKMRNTSKK